MQSSKNAGSREEKEQRAHELKRKCKPRKVRERKAPGRITAKTNAHIAKAKASKIAGRKICCASKYANHSRQRHKRRKEFKGIYMAEPILVIMAGGLGSRYGGLKQFDPVCDDEVMLDFSVHDAIIAGFKRFVFIVGGENVQQFEQQFVAKIAQKHAALELNVAAQDVKMLPRGYMCPEGRAKPWGTAHAVYCAKKFINAPFCVINADDFYGRSAFTAMFNFLNAPKAAQNAYAMVGYKLEDTLTENGHVSRGVCDVDTEGFLINIVERTRIERRGSGAVYSEAAGAPYKNISTKSVVSMNMWGFTSSFLAELDKRFPKFLAKAIQTAPHTAEFYLPTVVGELVDKKLATVKILGGGETWFGVTYKQDKDNVAAALKKMKAAGVYPKKLW